MQFTNLGKELANFIGESNSKKMSISKIYQGLPKKFINRIYLNMGKKWPW